MGKQKTYDREEKINEARDIFWAQGYSNLSTNNLIKQLGLVKQSFYNEFVSKEHLFKLVLQKYIDDSKTMFTSFDKENLSFVEFRNFFWMILDMTSCNSETKSCLLANASIEFGMSDSKMKDMINTKFLEMNSLFTSFLKHLQSNGEISESLETNSLGNLIQMIYAGSGILSRSGIEEKDIKSSIDIFFKLLKNHAN